MMEMSWSELISLLAGLWWFILAMETDEDYFIPEPPPTTYTTYITIRDVTYDEFEPKRKGE